MPESVRVVCGRYVTSNKKRTKPAQESGPKKLRDLYCTMFKAWGRLPDELGKQRPYNVFYLLNGLDDDNDTVPAVKEMPRDLQLLYGM